MSSAMFEPVAIVSMLTCAAVLACSCGKSDTYFNAAPGDDSASGGDADTDNDVDADADSDTGSDGDADGDADADGDGAADGDGDTDVDTETCTGGTWYGADTFYSAAHLAELAGYTATEFDLLIIGSDCVDLAALSCLTSVNAALEISDNSSLTSLHGLERLHDTGDLYVIQNEILTDISALANLQLVDMTIEVGGNDSLTDLSGLEQVQQIGALYLRYNDVLQSLNGLDGLETISGCVQIEDNSALTGLNGLASLNEIGNDIEITGNGVLPYCEICDLWDQLGVFAGDLTCEENLEDDCWNGMMLDCP